MPKRRSAPPRTAPLLHGTERLPRTIEALAANELRAAIVRGDLEPGSRIHQQTTAARLGVSLIPLREALKTLSAEGIVTHRPQRGYFVAELRAESVAHIYAARGLLEAAVEREAVSRVRDVDLEAMAAALARQERSVESRDAVEMITGNRRFHFSLLSCSENEWLFRFVAQLWDTLDPYRVLSYRRMWLADSAAGAPQEILREHRQILSALNAGEEDTALAALATHRKRSELFITELTPSASEASDPSTQLAS